MILFPRIRGYEALPSGTFEVTEIFNEEEFDTYFKDNLEDVAELVNTLLITAHGTTDVTKVTPISLL